ncbi:MAG: hypothetical protein WD557_06180 [Dehalococcoidia bacterium]
MTTIYPRNDTLAASVARLWLRVYTLGMTADLRERRDDQLNSDLWEHQADRLGADVAPGMVGLEVIGRMVRGMPADLLWRFQLEGPRMDIKIPFERVTGILLLVLVVVAIGSTSISGYDTGAEEWEATLRDRLGNRSSTERNMTIAWFTFCGLALVGGAAAFHAALQTRAPVLSALSSAFMAAAGVLVLVATASYTVMTNLAVQFVDGPSDPGLVGTSRAFALATEWLTLTAGMALAISVVGLVTAAVRERLVPQWLRWPTGLAVGLLLAGLVGMVAGRDEYWWGFSMGGALCLALTLLIAGFTLLLGRGQPSRPAEVLPAA